MSEVNPKESAKTKPLARPPTETVEHALRSAIDAHGPDAFYAGDALEVFLSRRCPDAGNDIALLRIGLDEQVPQALVGSHTAQDLDSLARQLQQRLTGRRSLNRYAAAWVVKTWTDALRLRSEAFPSTIPGAVPQTAAPVAAAPAPVVAPTPTVAARSPTPSAIPPRARAPILPASAGPARWVRIGVAIAAMVIITIVILFESRMSRPSPGAAETASAPPEPATLRADAKPTTLSPVVTTAIEAPAASPVADPVVPAPVAAQPSASTSADRRDDSAVAKNAVVSPRASPPCTRTTCGSIVAVRETGSGSRAPGTPSSEASRPSYEIIVRMDDRAIHTFRQPTMPKAGSRAKVVDGKLLVVNAAPPAKLPYREGRLVPESEPAVGP